MFELSVACKYLIPRRRQLSVSIISLISVFVIALVVWLIVVFFSVTDGLEKSWIQKLTALTAPVRITPTDAYYHSYYYQVDSISDASHYSLKTIREKYESSVTNPYNPALDEEIPSFWPPPDLNADGTLKDPVKEVYASLKEIAQTFPLSAQDFELTASHIRLQLLRRTVMQQADHLYRGKTQSVLSYPAYLGNFEPENPDLGQTLLSLDMKDLNNLLTLMDIAKSTFTDEEAVESPRFQPKILQQRLKHFFSHVTIQKLATTEAGWKIPRSLLPSHAEWKGIAVLKDQSVTRFVIPSTVQQLPQLEHSFEEQGLKFAKGKLLMNGNQGTLFLHSGEQLALKFPLILAGETSFPARLDEHSLDKIKQVDALRFEVEIPVQGAILKGDIPYRGLEIAAADIHHTPQSSPLWVSPLATDKEGFHYVLPQDPDIGEGVVLPKSFREAGVMIGDRGSLSYLSPTASILQEQHIPIYVAGFYDPGIIPIGGKFILANRDTTTLIRSSHQQGDQTALTNGINVRFKNLNQADAIKQRLLQSLKKKGIQSYWHIETYREYEFTKEIMRELQSQKNLFMLIAVVIILVACSNIISMLIILVNDKKLEIGILRSMGASSKSIACIFGLSGALIGVGGSVIGIIAAMMTLSHLDLLVYGLSRLQGHDMFNPHLYGQILPHELSFEALSFVLMATVCISLLAGIVPAIKACLLRPSHILRSSGE